MTESPQDKPKSETFQSDREVKEIIWQLKFNESPFLRFFGYHVWNAYQSLFFQLPKKDDTNLIGLEAGKAFIHAYYLYDFELATDYASVYDTTEGYERKALKLILRALNTIQSIHYLIRIGISENEKELLLSFSDTLSGQLVKTLNRPPQEILLLYQTVEKIERYLSGQEAIFEDVFSYFEAQRSLIFLPVYQTYLKIKNKFYLRIIQSSLLSDSAVEIMNDFLKQESCSSIFSLNFLQVESLLKLILGADTDYLFLEFADGFEQFADSDFIEPEPQGPTPFEILCDDYEEELEQLVSNMKWVYNVFNRFLHPKITDYVTNEAEKHLAFFDNNQERLRIFTEFLIDLAEKTQTENPFKPQIDIVGSIVWERGKQKIEKSERKRETMIIMQDRMPSDNQITINKGNYKTTLPVPQETEFIIKFGVTYFDMDRLTAFRANTKPVGYIQLFLNSRFIEQRGQFLVPNVHEMYIGKEVYLSLDAEQTYAWRDVVMLSLIALGQKYDVEISQDLQDFLVEELNMELRKKKYVEKHREPE